MTDLESFNAFVEQAQSAYDDNLALCREAKDDLASRGIKSCIKRYKYAPALEVAPRHSGFVYFIHDSMGHVKIGVSKDPAQRLESLQANHPTTLVIMRIIDGGRAAEKWMHDNFADRRMRGEWFLYCPTMLEVSPPVGGKEFVIKENAA